ncbi:MAG: 7TM diverse intracellular signaling domain-containing protein, partial [Patescibacteria group bacterium]
YSFRLLLTGEKILYIYLPFLSEEIMLRLEIASAFIATPMMHIFISRVFPNEFNKRFEFFSWCAFIVFIAIAVILPLFYVAYAIKALEAYVLFVLFHLLYIGVMAYINKSNGAKLFLLGFIGAFASGINDILFESGLPSVGRYISQYGVLLFIFVQSSIQAMRFASAYSELVILKNSLEDTVIERTKELTRLSDELSRLSLATSDLLEEERKYIARELHDDLGQTISGLKFRAEHIGNEIRKLAKDELNDLVAKAKDIENTLGGMYQRVRNMLRRLRPEIIDTMGLEIALEELLSKYRDGYHIKFKCVGDILKTSEHRSIFIYRICQEAITNTGDECANIPSDFGTSLKR